MGRSRRGDSIRSRDQDREDRRCTKESLGKTFIAPNLSRCRLFPLSTLTISVPRSITVSRTALSPARAAPPLARVLTLIRLSPVRTRSEEHTSELQSRLHLVCRLLLEKKKQATST